ncbi:MAG: hypothetical protein MZV49_00435 [Rhodopseudomonas palustris]|nr:hypothetical protein [Rhodopseudomonas palustris]
MIDEADAASRQGQGDRARPASWKHAVGENVIAGNAMSRPRAVPVRHARCRSASAARSMPGSARRWPPAAVR